MTGRPTYVAGGGAVSPDTDVVSVGFWIVDKKIQALTDDLRFSRSLFPGNTATVGGYFADYSTDDRWYLGNNELMTATPNCAAHQRLAPHGRRRRRALGEVTQNGILSGATTVLADHYDGRNAALFVSDQWHIGPWLLDAEYRTEIERIAGTVEGTTYVDLDDDPLTLYNNDTNVVTGQWLPSNYDHTLGAWSTGVNYERSTSRYERLRPHQRRGVHFPSFR